MDARGSPTLERGPHLGSCLRRHQWKFKDWSRFSIIMIMRRRAQGGQFDVWSGRGVVSLPA